jgi:hypothetical protein
VQGLDGVVGLDAVPGRLAGDLRGLLRFLRGVTLWSCSSTGTIHSGMRAPQIRKGDQLTKPPPGPSTPSGSCPAHSGDFGEPGGRRAVQGRVRHTPPLIGHGADLTSRKGVGYGHASGRESS